MFQVVASGKNESGSILIFSLGLLILCAAMIGGIFAISRIVYAQITKVETYKRIQDIQEYAIQEGATQIQKQIDEYLRGLSTISFGNDSNKLSQEIEKLFSDFLVTENNIGSKGQYSFEVEIESIHANQINPYILGMDDGRFGWIEDTSTVDQTNATNVALNFSIQASVEEKTPTEVKKESASSTYIFEVQWNDIDASIDGIELDVWRNIGYSHYLPNGANYLSADEWGKKMVDNYQFSKSLTTFDFAGFDPFTVTTQGYQRGRLIDYTDGVRLDFSGAKMLRNLLRFDGSFFFEQGVQLAGGGTNAALVVENLLAIKDGGHKEHFIRDLTIEAGNGAYINFAHNDASLSMSGQTEFHTSGLLLTNTQTSQYDQKAGLILNSGGLTIDTIESAKTFSFGSYTSEATNRSPQDWSWREFIKGSLLISSAELYAGPSTISGEATNGQQEVRTIDIDGNFLLTNASWQDSVGGFSYFQGQDEHTLTPYPAASIILDGPNTNMQIKGVSFIDAPKVNRQASPFEDATLQQSVLHNDSEYWNRIELKNGASMVMGYTGIEPFHLSLEQDSLFKFNLLPNLIFFDPTFLTTALVQGTLEGKVVVEVNSQADMNHLKAIFDEMSIPNSVKETVGSASNGEVTIIVGHSNINTTATQVISRTFSYLEL